jgi:hypothetical protein
MNDTITLTITEVERAEFEALLDGYLTEARKDKGEHERVMARVDERLNHIKLLQAQISAKLEAPCGGKSSLS